MSPCEACGATIPRGEEVDALYEEVARLRSALARISERDCADEAHANGCDVVVDGRRLVWECCEECPRVIAGTALRSPSVEGVERPLDRAAKKRVDMENAHKVSAASEDVELIDVFRGWYSKGPEPTRDDECWRRVVEFLEARVKTSGVTVHSCKADDMEPW